MGCSKDQEICSVRTQRAEPDLVWKEQERHIPAPSWLRSSNGVAPTSESGDLPGTGIPVDVTVTGRRCALSFEGIEGHNCGLAQKVHALKVIN